MTATVSLRGFRRYLTPVWLLAILSLALAPVASLSNPNPDTAEIRHGEIEFDTWRWAELSDLPDLIIPWKRPVYEAVVEAFTPFAR